MCLRKNLSNSIREAKEYEGLTYDDIMRATDCTKTSVRYALNGGSGVSLELMEKMLVVMGYSVRVEIEFTGNPEGKVTP